MTDATDAELIARLRTFGAVEGTRGHTCNRAADRIEAVVAERDALREECGGYLAVFAAQYARSQGLPDGHILSHHYDRMEELGCRMEGFTRAATP